MSKFLVYGLIDPRTQQLRYIGASTQGLKRPKQHWEPYYLEKDGNTFKVRWIRKLLRLGLVPSVVILEALPSAEAVFPAEQAWISIMRLRGAPLTNTSDGGEGSLGYHHSGEAKERIAASKRGRKRTPTERARMSASHRGRERTSEEIEHARQLGLSWKGKTRSPETRAKISAAKKGKVRDPETVAKVAAALRGRTLSSEHVEKMRQARQGKTKSPETRSRMAEAKKRWWAEKRAKQGKKKK